MNDIALVVFVLTYIGVALGEVPGLAIDRTGMAMLGAIAMVVLGVVPMQEAFLSVDIPTILLLYSLMVVSAQFRLGGFYTQVALSITAHLERPRRFMASMMLVSAGLSAILANDIVCLAFTPVLCVTLLRARLNPVPFLLGLAIASNIGSAATVIGNPQNMLIGQLGQLHFGRFFAWCVVPSVLSLGAAYLILIGLYRKTLAQTVPAPGTMTEDWPVYDHHQSRKGMIITTAIMVLFFTPIPRELTAIAGAGLLLCSRRMTTRSLLGHVDWHLITLFCALFMVVHGLESAGWSARAMEAMATSGVDMRHPWVLTGVSVFLSNIVSNVPATMLLVKFLDPADQKLWYILALSSTFAGNLITIGSIANLITMEQAKPYGVVISFREHARVGVPVTLASIGILLIWIAVAP